MSRFAECLPLILQHEGGYVDDPRDNGGATNLGITQGTLSAWQGRPATKAEVKALTVEAVTPIYAANYWRAAACDKLPAGVDYMIFDLAVNSGPGRAKRMLQEAVGVTADGAVGPATLAAVAQRTAATLIGDLCDIREAYYRSLDDFDHFGKGWLARLAEVTATALAAA